MKKVLIFTLSLGLAVALFLAVAAASITLSLYSRSDSSATESKSQINTVDSPENELVLYSVAVILKTDSGVYAANLLFNPQGYVESQKIELAQNLPDGSSLELLNSANIDPKTQKYMIFDQKIFAETTDRCGGLVYNEEVKGEVLLTGAQTVEKLNENNFTVFCEQLVKKVFKDNALSTFLYLADNTQHNVTFPEVYNILKSK